jgi:hypothetical protein
MLLWETLFESSINMAQSNFYVLTYLDLPGSFLIVSSLEVIMIESLLPCAASLPCLMFGI